METQTSRRLTPSSTASRTHANSQNSIGWVSFRLPLRKKGRLGKMRLPKRRRIPWGKKALPLKCGDEKVEDDSPYLYEGKGEASSPRLERGAGKVLRLHEGSPALCETTEQSDDLLRSLKARLLRTTLNNLSMDFSANCQKPEGETSSGSLIRGRRRGALGFQVCKWRSWVAIYMLNL